MSGGLVGQNEVLRVVASCGFFVGAPYWHNTEVYEPDECQWQAEVEVGAQDFAEGCAGISCPECGAWLTQSDDHLEVAA